MIEYKKPWKGCLQEAESLHRSPEGIRLGQMETLDSAKKPNLAKYLYLGDISKELGSGEGVKQ